MSSSTDNVDYTEKSENKQEYFIASGVNKRSS